MPGRWHDAGRPIVYLAESPAAALLEVCVDTSANDVPPDFTLLKIAGPEIPIPAIGIADLPQEWREQLEITRSWEPRGSATINPSSCGYPSALVPERSNFLFNPLNPDAARVQVAGAFNWPFDVRIKS